VQQVSVNGAESVYRLPIGRAALVVQYLELLREEAWIRDVRRMRRGFQLPDLREKKSRGVDSGRSEFATNQGLRPEELAERTKEEAGIAGEIAAGL
jgi:hypothetical protein